MSDIERQISYWIEMADYDLETAKVMLDGGRYLYVGFMCHQTVEKALKGYIWKSSGSEPLYTHSLARLLGDAELNDVMPVELRDFIDTLGKRPLNPTRDSAARTEPGRFVGFQSGSSVMCCGSKDR